MPSPEAFPNSELKTRRVDVIFDQALDIDPPARDVFLEQACAGDSDLRQRVAQLLAASAMAAKNAAWEEPAIAKVAREAAGAAVPSLDRYRLLERVGVGGMGVVYKAVRSDEAFSKEVAIKILPLASEDESSKRRFRTERQILAALEHPNIARLLDGGETADGAPFLVMEFVAGIRVDRYVTDRTLSIRARVELFRRICSAVAYAHRNLIVHRDLKPGNILVVDGPDGVAEPKLLDFGIARLLADAGERTGTRAMTLEYASPEQVSGRPAAIASDIYSLGVLFYVLLCGTLPYPPALGDIGLAKAICEQDPQPLKGIDEDLANIILMALRKEPARRYESAEQLSEDLRRFLDGYPVLARPDTAAYRAGKFIRRNRLGLGAAAVIALVLAVAAVSVVSQRDLARRNEERYHQLSYQASMTAAYKEWQSSNPLRTLELLTAQRPAPGEADLRGFEWYILWNLTHARSRVLREFPAKVNSLSFSGDDRAVAIGLDNGTTYYWQFPSGRVTVFNRSWVAALSPDGATLATADADGTVRLWDPVSHNLSSSLRVHSKGIASLVFSPDGQTLSSASDDGTAGLLPIHTSAPPLILSGHKSDIHRAVFSPNGKLLATASLDHTARLWDVSTGREVASLRGHTWSVEVADFSPDGSMLATSGSDSNIKLWNVATHREVAEIPGDGASVAALRFSPDGKLLAAGTLNGVILLIDLRSRLVRETLPGHSATISTLTFAPDGRTLFSASFDRTFRSWDIANETGTLTLQGHRDWVWDLKFSPVNHLLASAGKDATVQLWDIPGGSVRRTLQHQEWVNGVGFSPDGKLLASASDDRLIRIWDISSGVVSATLSGHPSVAECAVFSPDGRLLATGGKSGEILLWDVLARRLLSTFHSPQGNLIWDLAFSRDGKSLVAAEGGLRDLGRRTGHTITIWNPYTGALLASLDGHSSDVRAIAFSPDGRTLVSGSFDGTLKFWDFPSRVLAASIKTHKIRSLAFSPDGSRIVSAGHDKTVRLWNFSTRQEVLSLSIPYETAGVAFSPDGRRLAAGAHDGKVRIWTAAEPESGR